MRYEEDQAMTMRDEKWTPKRQQGGGKLTMSYDISK